MTKPHDIEEGRRICAAATEGPWEDWANMGGWSIRVGPEGDELTGVQVNPHFPKSMEFVCHTRTAYPEALDEIERLRGALKRLVSEACAGDAICVTMEPDRAAAEANGVDPDECNCFRTIAREALAGAKVEP